MPDEIRYSVYNFGRGYLKAEVIAGNGERVAYWTHDRDEAKTWRSYSGAQKVASRWPPSLARAMNPAVKGGGAE